jgi:CheY-like chemotaxis protein
MDNRNIKILLVDDEADFIQAMSYWFKSKGYSVLSAGNGQEALKLIKESPPDIVFLDINMPVMDGYQTLKCIREFNQDLPVIIISAYVDDQRARDTVRYGVSGIFYKGKDFAEGLSLLESALRAHKRLKH